MERRILVLVNRTDEASRVISAPPVALFAALVDADARADWLPPAGMTGTVEWFDARPGGGYRMVLTYDDTSLHGKSGANRDEVEVRFVEIAEPHRVVEAVDFVSDDPNLTGTMTMTWTVANHPDGSIVTITARDVPSGISPEDHAVAFASTLANLDDFVSGRAQQTP